MTLEEENNSLKEKIKMYEQNGAAKLYYALQRKMNEIGELFNKNSLTTINIDDPKDKSFDRIFKLLEKSEVVSKAAEAARVFAGVITGDEDKDTAPKNPLEFAESRK